MHTPTLYHKFLRNKRKEYERVKIFGNRSEVEESLLTKQGKEPTATIWCTRIHHVRTTTQHCRRLLLLHGDTKWQFRIVDDYGVGMVRYRQLHRMQPTPLVHGQGVQDHVENTTLQDNREG